MDVLSGSVSVVIPTYNRAHAIVTTIERVLAQTYADCHAIVVDDGSTDDTPRVMAARFADEPRVRYVRQENRGVSAARNAGLSRATGDYIAFCDSDDRWYPRKLERQLAALTALADRGVGMIWTNFDICAPAGEVVRPAALRTSYSTYALFTRHGLPIFEHEMPLGGAQVYWGDVASRFAVGNLCQPSTVLLTRARMLATGPFDETMRSGEDHAYHLAAAQAGPCALLDVPCVGYTKGTADQLTQPAYKLTIARNYLRTIEHVLPHADLPAALVREAWAEAHGWLGQEMFERGELSGARAQLAKSLRYQPWQPRAWMQLAMAAAPRAVTARARQAVRSLRALRALRTAKTRRATSAAR